MGVAAMFYAYLRMAEVRYRWTMTDAEYPDVQPNHALNTFWHATRLIDTTWNEVGICKASTEDGSGSSIIFLREGSLPEPATRV